MIIDVVAVLTDSVQPDGYLKDMRRRDPELSKGWVQIATPLSIQTEGGIQKLNCANTEGLFRIIQSIPSPKAEPFKRWLAKDDNNYAILTAEISEATFGLTPNDYKKLKGLKRQNLRDHMNDFELIFSMLGERSTAEITRNENSKGMPKLKDDAKAGGDIAGGARRNLEKRLGRSVISKQNYLKKKQRQIGK